MSTNYNKDVGYEIFFEEVWDYVSPSVVDNDMWDRARPKFLELTYELFQFYKNTRLTLPDGTVINLISSKIYARIIETFVKNFNKELS